MTKDEFVKWDMDDGPVTFDGQELLIVKKRLDTDGALATVKQYEDFEASYAHAFADDEKIMRHGVKIGTLADIKVEWWEEELA